MSDSDDIIINGPEGQVYRRRILKAGTATGSPIFLDIETANVPDIETLRLKLLKQMMNLDFDELLDLTASIEKYTPESYQRGKEPMDFESEILSFFKGYAFALNARVLENRTMVEAHALAHPNFEKDFKTLVDQHREGLTPFDAEWAIKNGFRAQQHSLERALSVLSHRASAAIEFFEETGHKFASDEKRMAILNVQKSITFDDLEDFWVKLYDDPKLSLPLI